MKEVIQLKAPEGCTSAGIGGETFLADTDGIVYIPSGLDYQNLLDHGFTPISESDLLPILLRLERDRLDKMDKDRESFKQGVRKGNSHFGRSGENVALTAHQEKEEKPDTEEVSPVVKKGKKK